MMEHWVRHVLVEEDGRLVGSSKFRRAVDRSRAPLVRDLWPYLTGSPASILSWRSPQRLMRTRCRRKAVPGGIARDVGGDR